MASYSLLCKKCGKRLEMEGPPAAHTACPHCGQALGEEAGRQGGQDSATAASGAEKKATASIQKYLGGFELIEKIGAGGMGTVFKARQLSLNKIVALKILKPSLAKNKKFVERFLREARSAAKLNHPNIVAAIEVGEEGGYHFFAMEYVEGLTLAKQVKTNGPFNEEQGLYLAEQVNEAFAHAWKNGIIHRDIKPENIMVLPTGEVRVMDMGLAKNVESTDSTITQVGGVIGTPAYASPEQLRGEVLDLDIRTDIYSLGCTLFFAVTGRMPFEGPTAAVILTRNLEEPFPSVSQVRPEISEAFGLLLQRMAEKEKKKRYSSPEEVIEAIQKVRSGEFESSPAAAGEQAPGLERLVRRARRSRITGNKRRASSPARLLGLFVGLVVLILISLLLDNSSNTWETQKDRPATTTTTTVARMVRPSYKFRPTTTTSGSAGAVRPKDLSSEPSVPGSVSTGQTPPEESQEKLPEVNAEALTELGDSMRAYRMGRESLESTLILQVAKIQSLWAFDTAMDVEKLQPRLEALRGLVRDGTVLNAAASRVEQNWVEEVWKRKQKPEVATLLAWRIWLQENKHLSVSSVEDLNETLDQALDEALAPVRERVFKLEDAGDAAAALGEYEKIHALGPDLLPQSFHEELKRLRRMAGRTPDLPETEEIGKILERARAAAREKDWTAFQALAKQLREGFGTLPSYPQVQQQLEELLLSAESGGGRIEDLFHGQVQLKPGGQIELSYDFSSGEQFLDWGFMGHPPGILDCNRSIATLRARFLSKEIEVECVGILISGNELSIRLCERPRPPGWFAEFVASSPERLGFVQAGQLEGAFERSAGFSRVAALQRVPMRLALKNGRVTGSWAERAETMETQPPGFLYVQAGGIRQSNSSVSIYDEIRVRGVLDLSWARQELKRKANAVKFTRQLAGKNTKNYALRITPASLTQFPGCLKDLPEGTLEFLVMMQEATHRPHSRASFFGQVPLERRGTDPFGEAQAGSPMSRFFLEPRTCLPAFEFQSGGEVGHQVIALAPLNLGEWHHLAASWDAHECRLFVDGCLMDARADMDGGIPQVLSDAQVQLGMRPTDQPREIEAFLIDEVRVSRAARYTENFEPKAVLSADRDTLLLLHFDEGEGNVARDSAGRQEEGTITEAAWIRTSDAIEAANRYQKAARAAEQAGGGLLFVPSSVSWADTGIFLEKGQTFSLRAQGRWGYEDSADLACGPEGVNNDLKGFPAYGLVGRITPQNSPFFTGEHRQLKADSTGLLQLMMNDDQLGDNSGHLLVTFRRGH